MILKNSLIYINQFFFFIYNLIRKIYLNSNIYNKKISKGNISDFIYKPSPSLLDCLVKYSNKKNNISDFSFNDVWSKSNIKKKDFKNLKFSDYYKHHKDFMNPITYEQLKKIIQN